MESTLPKYYQGASLSTLSASVRSYLNLHVDVGWVLVVPIFVDFIINNGLNLNGDNNISMEAVRVNTKVT